MSNERMYKCPYTIEYFSKRYQKSITVPEGYESDGASGPAADIWSEGWWVHDWLCDYMVFDDGTYCSNYQASAILGDILKEEGRWFRAFTWRWTTYFYMKFKGYK